MKCTARTVVGKPDSFGARGPRCGAELRSKDKPAERERHCSSPTCTWCRACFDRKRRECGEKTA